MKPTPILLATVAISVGASSLFSPTTQAAQKLLPFQGRLTDPAGTPVADGAKVVQFQLFDSPTGGTIQWAGEVQKLTVNGGLVSTTLGTKNLIPESRAGDPSKSLFDGPLYLQITIDAQNAGEPGHGIIDQSDPPLLPRQTILPVIFAVEAQRARSLDWVDADGKVQGSANWSALFGPNSDPTTGKIDAGKLADGSIRSAQIGLGEISGDRLAPAAIGTVQIAGSAVTSLQIADGTVKTDDIFDGTILPADLTPAVQTSLVPPGGIIAFVGDTAPPGWLLCDGAAVSRATYPGLYAVVGNTHGSGNGTTTFNLPDYRGRFLRGVDGAAGNDPDKIMRTPMAAGGNAGNLVGSVQGDELKSHSHALKLGGDGFTAGGRPQRSANHNDNAVTEATGGAETRPKNAYVNYIIKY